MPHARADRPSRRPFDFAQGRRRATRSPGDLRSVGVADLRRRISTPREAVFTLHRDRIVNVE
jgi:hypothetical protein